MLSSLVCSGEFAHYIAQYGDAVKTHRDNSRERWSVTYFETRLPRAAAFAQSDTFDPHIHEQDLPLALRNYIGRAAVERAQRRREAAGDSALQQDSAVIGKMKIQGRVERGNKLAQQAQNDVRGRYHDES